MNMKKWTVVFVGLLIGSSLISCGKDDESDTLSGYWIQNSYESDIRQVIGMPDDDGFLVGYASFKFLNKNTVEDLTTNCYLVRKSGCYHQETIGGRTVYFCQTGAATSYTYTVQGNKIIITDGSIGTITKSEIHIDGWMTFKKLCD